MRYVVLFLACLMSPMAVAAGGAHCRLALVLALDVSGSVNDVEYAQQLNGLAYALNSPAVRASILTGTEAPVHLAVFEWSSRNHQFIVQPWIALDSHAAIDSAVLRIRAYRKKRAGLKTALSTAMIFAADLLAQKTRCWERKIDVSGDGKNNIGPTLGQAYALDTFAGISVNALVVGNPGPAQRAAPTVGLTKTDLKLYFEREVIRGAGSFAMIAHGYDDYARAMQKKLLRELAVPVLGWTAN